MKKLTYYVTISLLVGSLPAGFAQSGESRNALTWNGIHLNGIHLNGSAPNGLRINGLALVQSVNILQVLGSQPITTRSIENFVTPRN